MAYKRKTHDEYEVQGYYGEWSTECTEYSRREAYKQLCCYRDNCKRTAFRIKKVRVANAN